MAYDLCSSCRNSVDFLHEISVKVGNAVSKVRVCDGCFEWHTGKKTEPRPTVPAFDDGTRGSAAPAPFAVAPASLAASRRRKAAPKRKGGRRR